MCYNNYIKYNYKHYKNLFTIIVPVLNEEKAIVKVINNIKNEGYDNILIVDGYSTDNTYKLALNENVKVVYQKGKGKTGAIETAICHVKTPFILIMDGDHTYHPKDIKNFYPKILKNDQVIGARMNGRENIPLLNHFGNFIINTAFNILFHTTVIDVCSGMYALRTQFAKSLDFRTKGFDVEVEIAAQAAVNGGVDEVPISYYPRIGEQKLQPFKDGITIFLSMINLAVRLRQG